jgi:hypothetical protein
MGEKGCPRQVVHLNLPDCILNKIAASEPISSLALTEPKLNTCFLSLKFTECVHDRVMRGSKDGGAFTTSETPS